MEKSAYTALALVSLSPVVASAGGEIVAPPPPAPAPVPVAPSPAPAPSPTVAREQRGPYVAFYGGANWVDDTEGLCPVQYLPGEGRCVNIDPPLAGVPGPLGRLQPPLDTEADFDRGWLVGGAIGYAFDFGAVRPRVELDIVYRRNGFDELLFEREILVDVPFRGDEVDLDGNIWVLSGLANLWLDFEVGPLVPYLGGGAGLALVSLDDLEQVYEGFFGPYSTGPRNEDDTVFAWQLGAGVAYEVTDSIAVTADYRWFNIENPDFDYVDAEYGAHSGMIGLRYSF